MKLTTGALQGQQWEIMVSHVGDTFPFSSFLTVCSLVLHLAAGSMRRYGYRGCTGSSSHPGYVLLSEGLLCPSTISRAWRRIREIGCYSRRAGQGQRRSLTHQQGRYRLLCARKNKMSTARATKWPPAGHWCECLWPQNQEQTSWGWLEVL